MRHLVLAKLSAGILSLGILGALWWSGTTIASYKGDTSNVETAATQTPVTVLSRAKKLESNSRDGGIKTEKAKGIVGRPNLRGLVLEGKSIGDAVLGSSEKALCNYFGEPTESYFSDTCKTLTLHWNDVDFDNNRGIYAFLKNDMAYQIETFTPRFHLRSVKLEEAPRKLIPLYPNLVAFELMNSASEVDGGSN